MIQLFKDSDPRRRWKGYWIHFYPSEYVPPDNKPFSWIHLHFKGQIGEVELYLKDYRIVTQWGKISSEEKNEIKKFVKENYQDIIEKIKDQFKDKTRINWDGTFKN